MGKGVNIAMMAQGTSAYRSRGRARMTGVRPTNRATGSTSLERLRVSVESTGDEADWYGRGAMGVLGLGFSGSLHQPVTDRAATAPVPVISGKGLRRQWGVVLQAAFIGILCILFITGVANMYEQSKRVDQIRRDIEQQEKANAALDAELAQRASSINVGYEAAQLNMIPAKSADVIAVTLPEVISTQAITGEAADTVGGERLATILGD